MLRASLDALAHRGPDDSGVFESSESGIGLVHVRLSILDISPLGHQPMVSGDGKVVLIFNGEIYNFRDLKVELELKGYTFHGHSDTEVLLNLYLAEGEAMLARLNGIFAFALWDARSQTMLLARDGLGVKPLYFSETPEGVAFASEIKGLLPFVPSTRALDPVALHRYLKFLWCPGEGTPLKNVRKLLPGEAMVLREGRVARRWVWYQLPVFRGVKADLSEAASIAGTGAELRAAVHRQMVADVPLGAFLSGGLDSSAVVAFARELNPDIHCFTIESVGGREEGDTDDLPYARRVAKHLNVRLEVVQVHADDMAADLQRMIIQLDEPLADPAPLNVLYISQLARRHGIKVLLSGAGGDDLFTGYRRHRALQLDPFLAMLPSGFRQGLESATGALNQQRPWGRRLAKMFNGADLEGDARIANYFAWSRKKDLLGLYSPEFRAQLGSTDAAAPMLDFLKPLPSATAPLDKMLALEQRFFLADHNLIYTDKMSMAAGVEVRVPFLDMEMVEFAQRIPLAFKQRGAVGKWVLKKAMEPHLPHNVIYRPKTGFGAPLRRWLGGALRPLADDLLSAASLQRRGLFDAAAVHSLRQADAAGRVDGSYTILSLMCIEIWCRHHVGAAASA
jgi:asparagine synthase (glutamine-hydrolysing)